MSDRAKQVSDGDDVRELLQVLTRIVEMVRRLPPGAERIAALEQIRDFQVRLSAILLKRVRGRPVHLRIARRDRRVLICRNQSRPEMSSALPFF